ncbi:unnamed protein product [Microthlaspi erraticum]|uniref:Transposase MuDR plant domain-containing protein n=1 Tax=Microthlaspi erraticum TaxID=1685480 RepID=A0A6D2KYE6_9BRAS|nr:unnamed protein product [Microthlaspi erraticum]
MNREGEDFRYEREIGMKTVSWVLYDISWAKFANFSRYEELVNAPIRFIWYKQRDNEMKTVNYVYDEISEDIFLLICSAKESGEIEIFLEYDCTEHNEPLRVSNEMRDEDETVNDFSEREDEDDNSESDEGIDRPKEDEEPEQSEDEMHEEEVGNGDEMHEEQPGNEDETMAEGGANVDDGEDVVEDAGDGRNDDRFRSLFEEGSCAKPVKEAYENLEEKEAAEREAEESEEECVIEEDAEYPDTPLESDEEWDQWDNPKGKRRGRSQFHGDLEKEPYIWLFQKFNSGLEFKDQLLRYSLKTQYDVKMARSEANRIAVVCCGENCKFRVYCSFEPPINKWMVKVCNMRHNHGKSSRVSMLKQGVIAGLFREELRRNVNLQAAVIKDTIKERYNIVVPISKCYRGRRIALNTIMEAQVTQFAKLWDYEAELKRTHPNIRTDLCTIRKDDEGVDMFDCFYICFDEFRTTWKNCCRPVIGLDGCFLKWELNGDLLSAVGRNADNRMYPIAWAVVRGETKDTWGWFIKKLKVDLDLGMEKTSQ